jgi:hypothetical protein
LDLTDEMVAILGEVHLNNPDGHHFGRPYVTAYKLAIELEARRPEAIALLGKPLGGAGGGERTSVAQYLSNQLSRLIRDNSAYPIEGAFMSNENLTAMVYRAHDGSEVRSTLAGTQLDVAMYRLRDVPTG